MKKVLLNTTALLATAGMSMLVTTGIATAGNLSDGVHIKGSAEIGIVGGSGTETKFHADLDVDIDLSMTLDNGLTIGASIDIDELGSGIPANNGPAAVYISGGFGMLTIGDTDGAFDWALKEAIIGGTINDVQVHGGYSGNSGLDGTHKAGRANDMIARYDNTLGDLSFALSAELDDSGAGADAVVGAGIKYGMGNFGFGLGFQQDGTDNIAGASVDASFGNIQVIVNYADLDTSGNSTGFALGYTMGDMTLAMNYGQIESGAGATTSGWGAIVNYALSGNTTLQAGYGSTDPAAGADTSSVSVGLHIGF